MKRSIIWATLFFAFLILFPLSCEKRERGLTISIVEEASYFSDFYVDSAENRVLMTCHIEVENTGPASSKVAFTGDFSEDFRSGLLVERFLQAEDLSRPGEYIFTLEPGINRFDVVFSGSHGAVNEKQNRLLPKIEITLVG